MSLFFKIIILLLPASISIAQNTLDKAPFNFEFYSSTCTTSNFDQEVLLVNNLNNKIRLINLSGDKLKIDYNGIDIKQNDTLTLEPLQTISFCLSPGNIPIPSDSLLLCFKTNLTVKPFDSFALKLNQFQFTQCDFGKNAHKTINISKSKTDSIKLYFPEPGTETTISVYKSVYSKKPIKQIWYEAFTDQQKSITFFKHEKGRYLIELGSCHFNGRCWLTIK